MCDMRKGEGDTQCRHYSAFIINATVASMSPSDRWITINNRPQGKESTKVQITQNKGKESENSYRKLKSLWWTGLRTHKHGNKIEIFWWTRPSFSIRIEQMYVSTQQGWRYPCHVLTYMCSLLIEKDGRVRWNISILFPCVCSCACPQWTLQFSVRVLTFFSLILHCQ